MFSSVIHPRYRPFMSGLFLFISLMPSAPMVLKMAEKNSASRVSLSEQTMSSEMAKERAILSEKEAIDRASRCQLADPSYPLVDGHPAFYSMRVPVEQRRPLPDGSTLCMAGTGKTAIVQGALISDIKSGRPEEIDKILKQRGLIK